MLSWFFVKGAAGIKFDIDFWDVAWSSLHGHFKKCKVFLFFHTRNHVTFTNWRLRPFYVTSCLSAVLFFSSFSLHFAVFLSPPWVFIASSALLLAPVLISAFSPALLSAFRFWSNFSCLLPVLLSLLSIFLTLTCSPFCVSDSNSAAPRTRHWLWIFLHVVSHIALGLFLAVISIKFSLLYIQIQRPSLA